MLSLVSQKCTAILLSHKKINEDQKSIYEYGFALLFSTGWCVLSVILLSIIFGYVRMALVFLLYFFPIRVVAGGYHAKSYEGCFVLTNCIAISCIVVSRFLWQWNVFWMDGVLMSSMVLASALIWKFSPVIPIKYQAKTSRYLINRRYSHIILGIEMVVLLLVKLLYDNCMAYTAVVTSCTVAIMMIIAMKGGRGNE